MKKVLYYGILFLVAIFVLSENVTFASKDSNKSRKRSYKIEVSYNGRELKEGEVDEIINRGKREKRDEKSEEKKLQNLTNADKEVSLKLVGAI